MIKMLQRFIPPVYFLVALFLMTLLHRFLPITTLFPHSFAIAGAVIILIGFLVSAWGAQAFRKADTPTKPFEPSTTLVTHGLYRYTRNPMYLGLMIILLGVWVFLGTLSPFFVIVLFFFVIQEAFIKHEEPFLEEIFEEAYHEYKAKVRRWF